MREPVPLTCITTEKRNTTPKLPQRLWDAKPYYDQAELRNYGALDNNQGALESDIGEGGLLLQRA